MAEGLDELHLEMEAAFARIESSIQNELTRAARTGEADMERLAASILATLAKAAVVKTLGGGGETSPAPVNVTMNFSGGAGASDAVNSSNQVAAVVARAVAKGMRFG